MNSLIVLPQELEDQRARLCGKRAEHAIKQHELRAGLEIKAALLGGRCGSARVLSVAPNEVLLAMLLDHDPPARALVDIVIAVPRPQTVKKVLHIACSCGVSNIYFVRSERTVKSYLQSKSLQPDAIESEIIKGLEQSCDSIPPAVQIIAHFHELTRLLRAEIFPRDNPAALLADPGAALQLNQAWPRGINVTRRVLLAIGPESGWAEAERAAFHALGFAGINLGVRQLRVETALTYLIGQIELLRSQATLCH